MSIWILTDDKGNALYFGDKGTMLGFIKVAFRSTYEDISEGIHSTAWGSPFWVKERMLIT